MDFTSLTNQAPFMLSHNTATVSSPKIVCPSLAPGDAAYVSVDASHYDGPVLTSGTSMLLAETKHSARVIQTDGMLKVFEDSPLTSGAGPVSLPKGLQSPCEIPSASDCATVEVNHCLDPLVIKHLEQQKSACEDFPASGSLTLFTEARESGGAVEIDGQLKTSDQCALSSHGITKPYCYTPLKACNSKAMDECDFMSLNTNPAFLVATENKQVSDIVIEDLECSHLSNESLVKMSMDIAETMECTPITAHDHILHKDGHLSFACLVEENMLQKQVEPKVLKQEQKDELMIDDEMLYQKACLHHQLNNKVTQCHVIWTRCNRGWFCEDKIAGRRNYFV